MPKSPFTPLTWRIFASSAALFLLGSPGLAAGALRAGEGQLVDRVVAVIENEIITLRELEEKAEPYMAQLESITDRELYEQRRRALIERVLDIEIGERIVNREIERNSDRLAVTEQDVDRAIDSVKKSNNLTQEQIQATLYGQGMTWSEYRAKMKEQIARARLIQFRVQGKVQVKDEDVTRRCIESQHATDSEKICASHILVAVGPDASVADAETARGKAAQLQAELSAGADFAAYAMRHSDDKGAPDGDIGCFGRGEMVEPFEAVAYRLQPGEISPVVRTQFGYHIIRVTDRKVGGGADCTDEATLERFRNEVYQEEMERQMNAWIAELRAKSFVDIRL